MSQEVSLTNVERRVFKSVLEDGLWDVLIGCFCLQFAIGPLLSRSLGDFWSSAVFLPFWALGYGLIWLVRKHVVRPRVGTVKFGQWRKRRLLRFNIVMFVVCCAALILAILSVRSFADVPGWVHMARFSLILLIVFSVAAYFLNFNRLYLYGVLMALSPVVGEWLWAHGAVPHHGFPATFGVTAAIIILTGVVKFVLLLRDHPVPAAETS